MEKALVTVTDKAIILDNGGKMTRAVCNRMNKASKKLNLGFRAYMRNYRMYCDYKGDTYSLHGAEGRCELPR